MSNLQTALLEQFQTFNEPLLTSLASGALNAQTTAKTELANRGLDLQGKWVGFDAAAQIMQQSAAPDAAVERIANKYLGLDTLDTRNSDVLDFKDQAVWQIKAALQAAFNAGKAAL
jgi:hypothetical protein